jgi:hypothetical protein
MDLISRVIGEEALAVDCLLVANHMKTQQGVIAL